MENGASGCIAQENFLLKRFGSIPGAEEIS